LRDARAAVLSHAPAGSAGSVGWESSHERGNAARADDEALLITGDGQLVEECDDLPVRFSLRAFISDDERRAAGRDAELQTLLESIDRGAVERIEGDRPRFRLQQAGDGRLAIGDVGEGRADQG